MKENLLELDCLLLVEEMLVSRLLDGVLSGVVDALADCLSLASFLAGFGVLLVTSLRLVA